MRATNSLSLVAAVFLCVTMIATGEQIVVEVVMKICVESGEKLLGPWDHVKLATTCVASIELVRVQYLQREDTKLSIEIKMSVCLCISLEMIIKCEYF